MLFNSSQYSSEFSLPSFFVIGFQIRAGDYAMEGPNGQHPPLTLAQHRSWFRCAEQVEATYALPGQRTIYYLISDSPELKEQAVAAMPGKVVSGIRPTWDGVGDKTIPQKLDGEHGVVSEMWLLRYTDFQILTRFSGLRKLPVWFKGEPRRTIRIPPLREAQVIPDCTSDNALDSFSNLAEGWSSG